MISKSTNLFSFNLVEEATLKQVLEAAYSISHFDVNVIYNHLANTLELDISHLYKQCVDFCK
jgi:predicted transcriptional regulator